MRTRIAIALLALASCGGDDASQSSGDPSAARDVGAGDALDTSEPLADAPSTSGTLRARLVALTLAGGAGDQFFRSVSIEEGARVIARADGFSLTWQGGAWSVEGDVSTASQGKPPVRPELPGKPGRAYEHEPSGRTIRIGYRQAGRNLQTTIVRAFEGDERVWTLWGHAAADIEAASLGADSRCYQAWPLPSGLLGVQCWTDGGNSVLDRDPRDLSKRPAFLKGAYQEGAGGMSTLYAVVDPAGPGGVLSGTFVASHVAPLVADERGRTWIARTSSSRTGGPGPENPFGQDEDAPSGVLVLDEALRRPLLHARIGGACKKEDGIQAFTAVAARGRTVALAGTSCARALSTPTTPLQQSGSGGQDAMLAILEIEE